MKKKKIFALIKIIKKFILLRLKWNIKLPDIINFILNVYLLNKNMLDYL